MITRYLYLLLMLACGTITAMAQKQDLKSEQIGINEGLSQSTVRCIFQDKKGFMWFGTKDGLNRYDGYKFIVFKKNAANENSLGSNDIKAITDDKDGNLWIATWEGGLNLYNAKLDRFTRYQQKTNQGNSISSNFIEAICRDNNNNIWIGTADQGLDLLNRKTNTFTHYSSKPGDTKSLTGNSISAIFEDSRQNIWVGTTSGLNMLNSATGTFIQYTHQAGDATSISDNNVKFIFEDGRHAIWIGTYGGGLNKLNQASGKFKVFTRENSNISSNALLTMGKDIRNNLWIGTENGGLNIFDPATEKFIQYTHTDNNATSISTNTINAIVKDAKGNIWIGTSNGGINLIKRDADNFTYYKHEPNKNSLSNNTVNSFYEDSKENLWIGTDGGGLNLFDRKKGNFTNWLHSSANPNSLSNDYVISVTEDARGLIWVGTWGGGISVYNPATKQFKTYRHNPAQPGSLNTNYAFYIFKDSKKRIWVGNYGGGLDLYNYQSDSFKHYVHNDADPQSISNNNILSINEDGEGHILVCTDGGGFNILNPVTGKFSIYKNQGINNSLSNNSVSSVFEDDERNLWIGTNDGLNKLDRKTNTIQKFYVTNGLPSNLITSITGDHSHNLWIATTRGLSKLSLKTGQFKNYTIADGLQSNEFKQAKFLSRTGQIYLGGVNGFNEFYPDHISSIAFDPPLLFTDFQIFNQEVPVAQGKNSDSPLKASIPYEHEITLTYKQSVITIDFASLNYVNKDKKQYSYILEGFDKQWHSLGLKNNVTYTNLDPGSYTLKVKGLNNEGVYSGKTAVLTIIVTPPFWKTWWFYACIILAIAGSIVFIFYRRVASIRMRNKILAAEVEKRTLELKLQNVKLEEYNKEVLHKSDQILDQQMQIVYQNKELEKTINELEVSNKTKDRFFSILAHDLRNPIAAISGISENLKKQLPTLNKTALSKYISHISTSAGSVLNLLVNLLEWARTQNQNLTCFPTHLSLYDLVIKNEQLMDQQMRNKNIYFKTDIDTAHIIYADKDMIDTVIRNILSNCIKFTPEYGQIRIEAEELENEIKIIFHDTGIGMTEEQIENIFSIEKQILSVGSAGEKGTGLGLMITKEFVEANNGAITISSLVNEGSTFIIRLPKGILAMSPALPAKDGESGTPENYFQDVFADNKVAKIKGKRILFVDDNKEIRAYLTLMLAPAFDILEAENGEEGIKNAIRFQPDLIISDMIMPVMSGLDLCMAIKNNQLTSHIPIILLTSQTNHQSQLSGYEAGADAYLTKPLSQPILFQVIYNLIMTQIRTRSKFTNSDEVYPDEVTYNKTDKEFLDKVIAYIEANLADTELDSRRIGEITNMSRTVLYAKFKMLTGQGVHDFIRSIRVKKGLQLLLEGRYNINQISYEVGFNTPSYFSKSFIKQFGIPPKEYISKVKRPAQANQLHDVEE
ncbi:hybrid sensor histidine kinase/response regulator transcription factor [Mucilaginibacter sp. FT3.2]|uniref:hybrid sensor histidine kinase/response regulator transcription factor n=1 Tax=Mucilaginibacter sp. FT3.2 TaxID=2723090 RepID=UPI0016171A55|nr:hybrid sensor histidine kinase/response regulator transcription factor [Mucilaginibacter sp. FT3.2]MBB6229813.1 ligand-binding sensor domain-containing protein/signal transduction histidine kinase/CheY-like chemotaxis protein [Mucilaginibacter sp. FT3.2]